MSSDWIKEELMDVELVDKRLEKRFCTLLNSLSKSSTASIPAATNDRAEMVAAYRFFANEQVNFANVLAPHIESSYRRVQKQKVALLVQDTTELDLTRPHSQVEGTGPLQNGRRCGAHMHLLHAFTTDGTPLGNLAAETWVRDQVKDNASKPKRGSSQKRVNCARKSFEEKESYRWFTTAEHCSEIKTHCPETQLVMLADQESDITEVIDYCRTQSDFDWIVRCDATRILHKENKAQNSITVHEYLSSRKPLLSRKLSIRERHSWGSQKIKHDPGKADRHAREVKVSVHAGEVTINDPRPGHADGVTVNAVLVTETKPNGVDQPIKWLLLTSLAIGSRELVDLIIEYYLMRWMIELYFKVLKSGCRIEERRFEQIDRFETALALYMIIAWRSLYVCRICRAAAESRCTELYTESEWKGVWMMIHKQAPPRRIPTLMEMTKLVASLGGYVIRTNAGPPGPQTIWLGLQNMHTIATCYLAFGPGAKKKNCV